jgi:hypothetical protein
LDNRNRKESAMAHQDQGREGAAGSGADELLQALRWLLAKIDWRSIALRKDCTWTTWQLVSCGLLWAWSDEKTLGERFVTARKIICFGKSTQVEPAASYQAFTKLLRKWTGPLVELLTQAFCAKMQQSLEKSWTVAGWFVLAGDGSRIDVPRTRGNEGRYSPQSKLSRAGQRRRARRRAQRRSAELARQRKANIPSIFLTALWHVASGLPWNWRAGPCDSSERAHLLEMLSSAPAETLLTADAGFVGYDLWESILASGCQLLVRVGSNVKLLKKLGYAREREGLVYLWPDRAAKQLQPPLVLRLIVVRTGRHPMHLVTSVMDEKRLPASVAAELYRRRWGIELFYRHCKQTFERRKLRSQSPHNAMVELHWSLLGMWAMGIHSHHYLLRRGVLPQRISFAGVLRAYRRLMREYRSPPDPGDRLRRRLQLALIDQYQRRNKASRNYPRKKIEPPPKPPRILLASRIQIQHAKQLRHLQTEKGLTA